ncbi:Macrophage scavenger receptor types I and II [Brachionus plicatilis]|uniref:Macrophage scavenger receptor types I and II n=1 Tax=Brachionus plicatilis TaxID=10195 RepID=A0A3M7QI36_BRAPC|nr:Macrophage scavenger receptor types I and II [Brachionus plicatilis]
MIFRHIVIHNLKVLAKERKCFFDHTIDKLRTLNFEEIRAFFCKERDLFANFDMVNYRLVTYEKRYPVCSSSKILLRRINLDQHLVPLKVLADGNCLFGAVSLFLYGNDSFHLELRVRCKLEMALNTDKYMDNHRFIEWISLFYGTNISGSINDLLKEEIMRLIENELRDPMQHLLLSNTISCELNSEIKQNVILMWTHTHDLMESYEIWNPNHFVPLVKSKKLTKNNESLEILINNIENQAFKLKIESLLSKVNDEFLNDESQLKNPVNLRILDVLNDNLIKNETKNNELNSETETDDLFQSFTETTNFDFDKLELKDVIPKMNLPSAVRTKSFFVFDLNLTKYNDIIRDENGSYWNNGAKKKFYEIDRLTEAKLKFLSNNKLEYRYQANEKTYEILRMTYFSKSQPAPSDFDRLFICFFWSKNNEKKNFNLLAHGNYTKTAKPYIRSSKEVLYEIKESLKKTTSSKSEFTKLLNEKNNFIKTRDNFVDAIFNMKKSDYDNLITVCFKDQQLFDLVHCGSFEKYYSGINFDTTYNMGDFYVSYFTYRNLSLNINGTDQHPIFMGPLMDFENDDVDKEKILYLIFGSTSGGEKSLVASNNWFLEHKARKIYVFFMRPNLRYKDKLNRGINKSIKERIPKSKNNLTEIFSFFEEMTNGQINSSKLAMIQSGDHKVSKLYKKSEVKANVWSMLGQTQQERKLEKFLKKWSEMEKKNTEKNVTSIYKLEN